jgi:hypothetical protein
MGEPWHNPGKWYVSPYNFAEETVDKFNLPPNSEVIFCEPSLSDEPQGVRYTLKDKIEIAQKFDEAGVGEIFHHIHGVTEEKLDCPLWIGPQGQSDGRSSCPFRAEMEGIH